MSRFDGKTALVTGGASGIGAAVARALHEEGAKVFLADRDAAAAGVLGAELGAGAHAISVDVREEEQVRAGLQDAGRLDVLVNAAGIGSTTTAPETELKTWEDVFAVNARGTFLCCKHAIPAMIAAGGGAIVNVASVAGIVGLRNRAAYCASKGAVVALTRALALDHAGDGIRVNAVCPGTVDTPWVRPARRRGRRVPGRPPSAAADGTAGDAGGDRRGDPLPRFRRGRLRHRNRLRRRRRPDCGVRR